jgi:hypothetical protein
MYIYINNPIEKSSFNSHSHGHFEAKWISLDFRREVNSRCGAVMVEASDTLAPVGRASDFVVASEYTNKRAGVTKHTYDLQIS